MGAFGTSARSTIADVVRTAVRRDAQLVFALHERLQDRAIALRLALHDVVVDALVAEVRRVGFGGIERSAERLFLEPRGIVLLLHRYERALRLCLDLPLRVRELRVDLLDFGMLVAVPLGELGLLPLQHAQLRPEPLDRGVLRDHRQRIRRGARRQRRDLLVNGLPLHARRLGFRRRVVQLVQPRQDDVLLVVERQRVLLVAVLRERPVVRFDFVLLRALLPLQPVEHVLRRLLLDREVLVDVFRRERVDRHRGEFRIHRDERDVHESAAAYRVDLNAAGDRVDHRGLVGVFIGTRRFGGARRLPEPDHDERAVGEIANRRQRRLRGRGRAVELRDVFEIELLDDAADQVAAFQNLVLRLIVGLGVLRVGRVGGNPRHRRGALVFDEQLRLCLVQRDGRVALKHHGERGENEYCRRDRAVTIEHREPVEQMHLALDRVRARGQVAGARSLWRVAGRFRCLVRRHRCYRVLVDEAVADVSAFTARTCDAPAAAVTSEADCVEWPSTPAKGGMRNGSFTTADAASPASTASSWLAARTVESGPSISTM